MSDRQTWRTEQSPSQEQLGRRVGYSGAQVGKIEMGERAPSQDFAKLCDSALPDAGGLFARVYALARRWDGGYPSWFTGWIEAERRATSLCTWQPLLARTGRQSIFERPKPPGLWVILDEAVLHRCVGSAKIMYDQLAQVLRMSDRVNVTVQVVPGSVGAHVGLLGGFAIASAAGAPGTAYMETPDEGQTTELPSVVAKVSATFDTLRAEALPRAASRDLIRKVPEERWTE